MELFMNPNEFSLFIETTANEKNALCIETIVSFCAKNDINIDQIACYVNDSLKSKLAVEFADVGMMEKKDSIFDLMED